MKKVLDHDPLTGISHVFYYDNETDTATITAEQKIENILEANKAAYNERGGKWEDMTHVAQIPMVVYVELKKKGILNDQEALRRWLNDSENRFFRTRPGTI